MNREQLVLKAKQKATKLKKARSDPRFLKVIGKFKQAGLLIDPSIPARRGLIFLDEVLWAAKIEPRLLELLPAVLIKKPSFVVSSGLPADLKAVVDAIRLGRKVPDYRGVRGKNCEKWLSWVGRTGLPSIMRSFRFQREDLDLLARLSQKEGLSQTETLRRALRYKSSAKD